MKNNKRLFYWDRLISLLTCILMIAAVALQKNGTLAGHEASTIFASADASDAADTISVMNDGTIVVNTSAIGSDIKGYGGPTPLRISIKDNTITHIESLPNVETPDFFYSASEMIFPLYVGKTLDEIALVKTDAISGATFSSMAIHENIRRGIEYVHPRTEELMAAHPAPTPMSTSKTIASCLVILMGALLPLWLKGKGYRIIQLLLNVAVLGCWCGTFINYSLLVNYLSNGVHLSVAVASLLLIAVATLMPLFGRSRHYCLWLCPLGSAQELMGKILPFNISIPPKLMQGLTTFKWALWSILMLVMWTGVWFEWMDYELFSIFMFQQASWIVIVLAALCGICSLFVSRPYCRFVCPTGTLMQIIENKKLSSQM
ncbi:MAG: 4Fe-4S binding protein [Bacteroidales bacterium]|nr:4Fe-4S binding protein [Bacteroidales bacterium]